ncbi:cell wall-active antibiotics response protein LiaF [Paenibacillus marinisediminis]
MNLGKRWMLGFILIGAGVIFLLQQMGYISFDLGEMIRTFWPLILVFVGLSGLLQGGFWGIFPLGIGVYYLLRNLNIITLSWSDFMSYALPFGLIVGGLWVLFKPRKSRSNNSDWQGNNKNWNDDFKQEQKMSNQAPASSSIPDYGDPNYPDPFKDVDYSKDIFNKEVYGDVETSSKPKKGTNEESSTTSWEFEFGMGAGSHGSKKNKINKSTFIGDFHIGQDYWELRPMDISHFIGDSTIDLTKAQVPYGETKITVSSFIGDVKVYIPRDMDLGVTVTSSSFIGDVRVLDEKESGFMRTTNVESPYYHDASKKVRIVVSTFIGDVRVKKVG